METESFWTLRNTRATTSINNVGILLTILLQIPLDRTFSHSVMMHLPYLALTVTECCLVNTKKVLADLVSHQHVGVMKAKGKQDIHIKGN